MSRSGHGSHIVSLMMASFALCAPPAMAQESIDLPAPTVILGASGYANGPFNQVSNGLGTVSISYPADPNGAYPAGYAVATASYGGSGGEVTAAAAGNTGASASLKYYFYVTGPANTTVPITFTGTFTCANDALYFCGDGFRVSNSATFNPGLQFLPDCNGTVDCVSLGGGPFVVNYSFATNVVYQIDLVSNADPAEADSYRCDDFSLFCPPIYLDATLSISIGSGQFQLNVSSPPLQISGKSLGTCVCPVGNPIDVGSGNKYETVVDYHTAGPNQLSFERYYNSLAGSGPIAVEIGNNWRSTYDRYLTVGPLVEVAAGIGIVGGTPTTVSAQRANGQILSFTASGGNWVSDSDVDVQLVQTNATTWALTDHDDTIETYTVNGSGEGLLTSIQARNGYTQTLHYNTSDQLTSVTDTYNRTLSLTYAGGLLQAVTTPDGLVLTYAYTAAGGGNQLTSVSYSTTPTTSQTYLYENAGLPFALTGIIDEDGNRYATWTYDSFGRGLSSQHASGADLTTVAYDDTTGNRTVSNALGEQMLYKFTTLQGVPKVTEIDRLASSTTAAATKTFTYDSNGYAASVTDWNGNLTTYVNDVHGQPTSITEASGTAQARTTTITYLTNFHLPVSIVTPGLTTAYTYDANGEALTKTDTDTTTTAVPYSTNGSARTTTYTWANSLLASMQGSRTDIKELTTYAYDGSGALAATTNPLNQTTRITNHLPGGLPQTIVDPNGVTTNLVFDARNRLLSRTVVTVAGSLVTSYTYDAAGNLLTVTQPDGSSFTSAYDLAHRLTGVTDLFQESMSYTLDALGDRTQTNIADATGTVKRTHSARFDARGRLLQDIGGVGQTTAYTYDGNGNVPTVTDPLKHQTQQAFDALNRLVTATDPAGNVIHTSYDAHDRVVGVTDPNGGTTAYTYDGFGDLIQQASPTTGTTVYRYDPAGNLVQRVDARGVVANFTYDALDRVATVVYPGDAAENVTYTYDQTGHGFGVGRLTSVADAAGTLSRSYDERGNVVVAKRVQGSATLSTTYGYDAAQRIVSIGYPSGLTAGYARDAMGRVTGITVKAVGASAPPVPVVSGVGYEPFGPANALTFGNGVAETRTFDADYRETLLSDTGKNPVQQRGYSYDLADNVSSITDSVTAANSQAFGYDALNRLTSASGGYGNISYAYDPLGNRLSDTSASSFPALDGLGSISGLAYNQAGRVSAVTAGSNQVAGYSYDAFGNRLARSGANAALYQYDLSGHLLEETDGQANPQADYIYLGDQPIASVAPVSGNVYFLQDDRFGTPQVATDVNQTIQWTANYQPFGATNTGVGLIAQDLRLPGQEFDSVTGWNHNGFREYAPGLGRYLESDPIGLAGGLNLVGYASGNPIRFSDPAGLSILPDLVWSFFKSLALKAGKDVGNSLVEERAKCDVSLVFGDKAGDETDLAYKALLSIPTNVASVIALARAVPGLGPKLVVAAVGFGVYYLYQIGTDLNDAYGELRRVFYIQQPVGPLLPYQGYGINQ